MIRIPVCLRHLVAFPVLPRGCARDIKGQSLQTLLVALAVVSVLLDALEVSLFGDSLFLEVATCCVFGLLAENFFGISDLRSKALKPLSADQQRRQEEPQHSYRLTQVDEVACKHETHAFSQELSYSRVRPESFSVRIANHLQEGKLKSAISVFESARQRGINVDPSTNNAMVRAFAKLGKCQQAVSLLEEVRANGACRPDHDTYLLTLGALCKSKGGKCWMTAFELLNQMHAANIKPDPTAYAYVIKSCARDHQWERALALLDDMTNQGIEPSVFTYNAALHVLAKSNLWERALAMMDQMKAKGLQPDTFTYNQVISALGSTQGTHAWEHALALFEELRHSGIAQPYRLNSDKTMMIHMYNSVIAGCACAGSWQQAWTLMQQMRSEGFSVPKATYESVVNACSAGGEKERATALLDEMRATCDTTASDSSHSPR